MNHRARIPALLLVLALLLGCAGCFSSLPTSIPTASAARI